MLSDLLSEVKYIGTVNNYCIELAYEYDKKLMSNVKGYTSRYKQVANYVEESKQKV
jgi:hypothetical protein